MSEEEQAKILLCGAAANLHSAEAAGSSAAAILEMDNLVRQTIPDLDHEAQQYYDEVARRARRLQAEAEAISDAARAFQQYQQTQHAGAAPGSANPAAAGSSGVDDF